MRILMLGWEYPPLITGGLGIASQGLAEALADSGHDVTFLLPKLSKSHAGKKVKLADASTIQPDFDLWKEEKEYIEVLKDVEIGQLIEPYLPPSEVIEEKEGKQKVVKKVELTDEAKALDKIELTGTYESNLGGELTKYALLAVQFAKQNNFDVIHAHDWLTFKAGIMASQLTKKKLFVHVHSTEYDRNGMHAQPAIIAEEKEGLHHADHIFCVSKRLQESIIKEYGIVADKISVTPNAIEKLIAPSKNGRAPKHIAFVGRLTHQKNPTFILDLARELTSKGYDFNYSIIGDGFLRGELEEKLHRINLHKKFRFTGFLERAELLKELSTIDLLVVPSVSEPFGLVILEAVSKKVPVAAAKDVGIAEYIPSLPQVDRWDVFSYANMVEKLMTDIDFRKEVINNCFEEAKTLTWDESANKVVEKYAEFVL